MVEVEVDGDGIALGRNNVDSGGAGGKGLGGEVELESGARNFATAVIGADEVGMAGRREGPELFVVTGDLHVEIFPERPAGRCNRKHAGWIAGREVQKE